MDRGLPRRWIEGVPNPLFSSGLEDGPQSLVKSLCDDPGAMFFNFLDFSAQLEVRVVPFPQPVHQGIESWQLFLF